MSNHEHNNIYSILGKLEALTPKESPAKAEPQKVYESVDARGSMLEGVAAVEARLNEKYMGFKKTVAAIKKGGSAEDPEAVAAAIGRKKYGKEKFQKAAAAGKKLGEEQVDEKAVSKAQQKFMGMVHAAHKGEKAASPEVAKVAAGMSKKAAKDYAATKHKGLPQHVGEGEVCSECGMMEGECEHTRVMEKEEKTHKGGEVSRKDGVTTHRKTDFPGYQSDDDREEDDDQPKKAGRPRKHAKKADTGEKKGRGRPKKAPAPKYSDINDPFGRVPSKAPKSKIKGKVHKMDESIRRLVVESVNFKRMMEEQHMTLDEMLETLTRDIQEYKMNGNCSENLRDFMEVFAHAKKQADETVRPENIPAYIRKQQGKDFPVSLSQVKDKSDTLTSPEGLAKAGRAAGISGDWDATPAQKQTLESMTDELDELAKLAGITIGESIDDDMDEGNAFTGKLKSTPKGGEFELDGKKYKDTSSLEEEPNEGNAFTGKLKSTPKGGEFELDGKKYKDTSDLDECGDMPMNDQADEFNINTSMNSNGDKNITISASGEKAAELLQMLKLAGMESHSHAHADDHYDDEIAEEEIEYDEGNEKLANAPDEEYGTIKQITSQGDDLNRPKRQDPGTANKAANPFTNNEKLALEARLQAEYDSIKKVSK